ncbi:helix-turn-helix domain-containing protein [Chelonobacter oris]|uniref:helix-turn-helix domain-containing protein n=1 Tax=Chelonobacter oris TaxID=505317 RepID=UPI003CC5BA66
MTNINPNKKQSQSQSQSQSQNKRILAFLQNGGRITSLEALNKFGCLRLSARILDLRNDGYQIYSKTVKDPHTGKRFIQTGQNWSGEVKGKFESGVTIKKAKRDYHLPVNA